MSNPQKALNDFLSSESVHTHDSSRKQSNKQSSDEGRSSSQPSHHHSGGTNNNNNNNNNNNSNNNNNGIDGGNDDDYDYEMQDYRPSPQSARPTPTYVPQYSVESGAAFPIQEVIPNAYINTQDINHKDNGPPSASSNRAFRPRGQTTVSANVLNIEDFYKNADDAHTIPESHLSRRRSRSRATSNAGHSANTGATNGRTTGAQTNMESNESPRNVPIMVKPKTLYQNPQTPTVLPSTYHPINKWSSVKNTYLKEFLAEFMGTMVMIIFGSAVVCQVNVAGKIQQDNFNVALDNLNVTGSSAETIDAMKSLTSLVSSVAGGTFDDVALGWAAAVVMGYFCAGGSAISGAHLNPSITLANLVYRGFPLKKVPYYFAGQLIGAFTGALILFIWYKRVLQEAYSDWWMNESVAGMFCVFPKPYLSSGRQFFSEFLCGAMLQAGTFALTDPYTCLSSDVFPLMMFILIFIINASMAYQTGTAMNLARDLGPRLALYAVGFDHKMLWVHHHHFFWVPMVGPFVGALMGGLVYDVCIYQGHESPVNWSLPVYKEMIMRAWFRRPGWKKRNRARRTSDLSDFSYNNDDDEEFGERMALQKTKTKSSISDNENEAGEKKVQFKSVQRGKRTFGGIPTILEEEDSIETASLGATTTDSIGLSDTSSEDSHYGNAKKVT